MKKIRLFSFLLCVLTLTVILLTQNSCNKDEEVINPTVTTTSASSITETTAIVGGNVTSEGSSSVTERGIYYGTSSNPESTGTKVQIGSGTGSFSQTISGLSSNTTYYIKAYAINSEGTAYGNEQSFTSDRPDITGQTGTLTDYDGNSYNWIGIGKQAWMAENIKSTHYANGTAITLVESTSAWDALGFTDKAYCYYDNSSTNADTYGTLYTWAAAMNGASSSSANPSGTQGACPDGWHLPSDAEWTELTDYLGGESVAGGKMKETGTTHWLSPNTGATNESGFKALPAGNRFSNGMFNNLSNYALFWSASEYVSSDAWNRYLSYSNSGVGRTNDYKDNGFSVRCLKD